MITEITIVLLIVAIWLCGRGMIAAFNYIVDRLAAVYLLSTITYGIFRGFLS